MKNFNQKAGQTDGMTDGRMECIPISPSAPPMEAAGDKKQYAPQLSSVD